MNDSAIFGMLGLLIGGAGVWAVMRWKTARLVHWLEHSDSFVKHWWNKWKQSEAAHSRLSDAHNTQSARIERAIACVTDRSAHVGKKMAAILTGERK